MCRPLGNAWIFTARKYCSLAGTYLCWCSTQPSKPQVARLFFRFHRRAHVFVMLHVQRNKVTLSRTLMQSCLDCLFCEWRRSDHHLHNTEIPGESVTNQRSTSNALGPPPQADLSDTGTYSACILATSNAEAG